MKVKVKGQELYGLYEVYWNKKKPHSRSEQPVMGYYETANELYEALDLMLKGATNSLTRPMDDFAPEDQKCTCKAGEACSECQPSNSQSL